MYTIQASYTYNIQQTYNTVRAKLESRNGKYFIEIPKTLVDLYSLESGMTFEIKATEARKNILIINLSASLAK